MKKMLNKKAFTLIEMLVVVVIIGLLIGIMGGKYQSFLQSGRDMNRQGGLRQMATQLEKYRMDYETFPAYSGCVANSTSNTIYKNLVLSGQYMDKLPVDPNSKRPVQISKGGSAANCKGQYFYGALIAAATENYGYVLFANAETPKGINVVTGDNSTLKNTRFEYKYDPAGDGEGLLFYSKKLCNSVVFSGSSKGCDADSGITKGGIKKGSENYNGWFAVMGGG